MINQQHLINYENKIQFNVELHLSLIVPVVEYLNDFYFDHKHLFKREFKRNHNIIIKHLNGILNESIKANGEDNVYKYVDIQNEMIDNISIIKDHKKFNNDLRKCISRNGVQEISKPLELDEKYNVFNDSTLARYYDCLLYVISQYDEIKKIVESNSLLKITAYKSIVHKALMDQCEFIYNKIKYIGNPYIINSLLYYILAKSHLRDKSTVFDNEVEMIIKKHS